MAGSVSGFLAFPPKIEVPATPLPVPVIWQNCLSVDSVPVIWQNCLYVEECASDLAEVPVPVI